MQASDRAQAIVKSKKTSNVIEAAGGLVWRKGTRGRELAVIHRPKYDDWTLPKGKRKRSESWEDAAIREVEEETGCQVDLGEFAGCLGYVLGDTPKIVLFWSMKVTRQKKFVPNDEVDQVVWLTPSRALRKLDYDDERELLEQHLRK